MTTTKISAVISQKCIEIKIWFCLHCKYRLKFWGNWKQEKWFPAWIWSIPTFYTRHDNNKDFCSDISEMYWNSNLILFALQILIEDLRKLTLDLIRDFLPFAYTWWKKFNCDVLNFKATAKVPVRLCEYFKYLSFIINNHMLDIVYLIWISIELVCVDMFINKVVIFSERTNSWL